MNKITQYLNQHIVGNVYDKPSILEVYSTDRSILKVTPKFVALPETTSDVRKLMRFINQLAARNYKLPVAVRGSGLDKTGSDLSSGLVISTERLNQIQEIDVRDRLVRVQAGVTLGQLNSALALHGLTLPIKADHRETIGGLISTCATDPYSYKYGGIVNYVNRAEIVLPNGDCLQTTHLSKRALNRKKSLTTSEGIIYRDLDNLLTDYADVVSRIPTPNFNLAGYPKIAGVRRQKPATFDLLPLFFGAQGTLGIITEVILECAILPPPPKRLIASFGSIRTVIDFMNLARFLNPAELTLYDTTIFIAAEKHGKRPELLTRKLDDDGYTAFVSFNDSPRKSARKVKKCVEALPKNANPIVETKDNALAFSDFEGAISTYLNDDAKGERVPILDDFYIPSSEFLTFFEGLKELEKTHKTSLPIFGSYATGVYSVRPDVLLDTLEGRQFAFQLLRDFNQLLKNNHGVITGGAPEGRIKALLTNPTFTIRERKLYQSIKSLFDPNNILGSETKLGADPRSTIRNLRVATGNYIVI